MDRLQLALSRAEQLLSRPRPADAGLADRECWLTEEVCPLAEDLAARQRFRELARWPLRQLTQGRDTPQRRLIEQVDANLVGLARRVTAFVGQRAVQAALRRLQAATAAPSHPWGVDAGLCEEAGCRPWLDLVAAEDYLTPHSALNTHDPEQRRPWEWEMYRDATDLALLGPGDYLSRLLSMRLDYWRQSVERLWSWCLAVLAELPEALHEQAQRLAVEAVELAVSCRRLRQLCQGEAQARLREACITLVQALAAYGRCPQLDWLGLPGMQVENDRSRLRRRWRQGLDPASVPDRLVAAVAGAVVDVRQLYGPPAGEDVLAEALASSLLVLVEQPRAAYWRGRLVEASWDGKTLLWELLWELARQARQGRAVDRLDLSNSDAKRALVSRRSRLGALLPAELDRRICAAGRGSYRLDLGAEEITLLQRDQHEQAGAEGSATGRLLSGRP